MSVSLKAAGLLFPLPWVAPSLSGGLSVGHRGQDSRDQVARGLTKGHRAAAQEEEAGGCGTASFLSGIHSHWE